MHGALQTDYSFRSEVEALLFCPEVDLSIWSKLHLLVWESYTKLWTCNWLHSPLNNEIRNTLKQVMPYAYLFACVYDTSFFSAGTDYVHEYSTFQAAPPCQRILEPFHRG